jgi:hypothetical protein
MFGNNLWIWLIVGLIPYYIKKQPSRNGWILQIRALFWSLELHRPRVGLNKWTIRVPLIERLRSAVWAAIVPLQGDDPQQD